MDRRPKRVQKLVLDVVWAVRVVADTGCSSWCDAEAFSV